MSLSTYPENYTAPNPLEAERWSEREIDILWEELENLEKLRKAEAAAGEDTTETDGYIAETKAELAEKGAL